MITFQTFWDIYRQLLQCFLQDLETHDEEMTSLISSQHAEVQEVEQEIIPLIEGLKELRQGDQVVGSSTTEDGDGSDYGSFTDDSNDESNESDLDMYE